jgi:hypothetical protein
MPIEILVCGWGGTTCGEVNGIPTLTHLIVGNIDINKQ